jgi:hypothetical protein
MVDTGALVAALLTSDVDCGGPDPSGSCDVAAGAVQPTTIVALNARTAAVVSFVRIRKRRRLEITTGTDNSRVPTPVSSLRRVVLDAVNRGSRSPLGVATCRMTTLSQVTLDL